MLNAAAMSSTKMAAEIGAVFFMCRSWHYAGNPRRPRRLYRVMAESPERRQAGDLHRRKPCAEGRRLPPRAATASRHSASRGLAGGSLSIDRGRGRASPRPLSRAGIVAAAETAPWRGCLLSLPLPRRGWNSWKPCEDSFPRKGNHG